MSINTQVDPVLLGQSNRLGQILNEELPSKICGASDGVALKDILDSLVCLLSFLVRTTLCNNDIPFQGSSRVVLSGPPLSLPRCPSKAITSRSGRSNKDTESNQSDSDRRQNNFDTMINCLTYFRVLIVVTYFRVLIVVIIL